MTNKQKVAAVALLIVACAVSGITGYQINNSRHYEAACRMADVIHCYNDYLLEDTTSQDYGYFEEVQGVFLLDEDPIDMTQYSWAY